MNNAYLPGHLSHEEVSSYDQLVVELAGMKPEQMLGRLKQYLMTYPSFALAHNDLGVLYHRLGNPTLALAHYEKAARLQPDNLVIRKNLADFYAIELGWLEDAVEIYLDVLKRNPRDTEALCALGKIGQLMAPGGHTEPELRNQPQTLSECSGTDTDTRQPLAPPAAAKVHVQTADEGYRDAVALSESGNVLEAVRKLQELIRIYPDFAPAYNDLGVLLQQVGELDQALQDLRKAVELQPDNVVYTKNLADFLVVCMQDYERALELYNTLLAKHPRDKEVLQAIGHVCIELDNSSDACYFLERALALEPWHKELRDLLQKLKEPPVCCSAVCIQDPAELYTEAMSLAQAGQYQEARAVLEALIKQAPTMALAYNDLGVTCHRLGDNQSAERYYRKAVELEPATVMFRKNLADLCFVELGKVDESIQIYLDLHKKFPRDVEVLIGLGHITKAVGHFEEAKQFYRKALEIEPWNREVREALQGV